jgi:hypothetical protein
MCRVLKDLYEPEAFFGRVDDLYLKTKAPFFAAMRDVPPSQSLAAHGRSRQRHGPGCRSFRAPDAPRSRNIPCDGNTVGVWLACYASDRTRA